MEFQYEILYREVLKKRVFKRFSTALELTFETSQFKIRHLTFIISKTKIVFQRPYLQYEYSRCNDLQKYFHLNLT